MRIEYIGLTGISGSQVSLEGVADAAWGERAAVTLPDGTRRRGRVVMIDGDRVVIELMQGTDGLDMQSAATEFSGEPLTIPLSREILGRVFNGSGRPADGFSEIFADEHRDIGGEVINPVARSGLKRRIFTGISAIDATCSLMQGQKLPIFSGSGLPHNRLAAQIIRQAHMEDDAGKFAVVFCAVGIKSDSEVYFKREFINSGALERTVMYINRSSDPVIERITAPRSAMTAAEYLAFTLGYNVLVLMSNMTSYCEALREVSSARGELPARKGFPNYMYSDLASLFERAGVIEGRPGSVTLMPMLTLPDDDMSHPVPDTVASICEGKIVLSRALSKRGLYPPIDILASRSRLMSHSEPEIETLVRQINASYAEAAAARRLAGIIGESGLSALEKQYLRFAAALEERFAGQGEYDERSFHNTIGLGWRVLSLLPRAELSLVPGEILDAHYRSEGV